MFLKNKLSKFFVIAMFNLVCIVGLISTNISYAQESSAQGNLQKGIQLYKKENFKESYSLLLPFAEKSNAEAQYYIGSILKRTDPANSIKTNVDYKWKEKSAMQGYYPAMYDVAMRDRNAAGDSTRNINWDRIYNYLTAAAENDLLNAQKTLANMYQTGVYERYDPRFKANMEEAYKWYLRAAKQGDSRSAYALMEMSRDGDGVKKNMEEAMFWCIVHLDAFPVSRIGGKEWLMVAKPCSNTVAKRLTKKQIKLARLRANAWVPHPIDANLKEKLEQENKEREATGSYQRFYDNFDK